MKTRSNLLMVSAVLAVGIMAGCDRNSDEQVRVVDVPKEPHRTESAVPTGAPAIEPASVAGGERIDWDVPAGWQRKEETGQQMRYAAFTVDSAHPDVLVTVVPLGGEAGSLLANVNRWEGQLGLPASSESDLGKVAESIQTSAGPATLVDLKSPAQRILAGILKRGETTWFIKLMGPSDVLKGQEEAFKSFVKSTRFAGISPLPPAVAPSQEPSATGPLTYTVPAGWEKQPPRTMRIVSFALGTAEKKGEVIVSQLPTGAGDFASNVNRWRGQVGLEPIDDADPAKLGREIAVGGDKGRLYDFAGKDRRQVVVVVNRGGNDWFFKLIGPSDLVESQQADFVKFLSSVHFAD